METKGELTKHKIIKAARNLFKYQGYKNTTIDDICKGSNVKRGNLYFYFKGKEELAYAAINDAVVKEFPFLEKMMGEQADPLKKIEIMIDGMAEHIINEDCKGG
jgi:TetR/AcrR family transcriptional repressor of nem operon